MKTLSSTPVSDPQHAIIFQELMTNLTKHIQTYFSISSIDFQSNTSFFLFYFSEENEDLPKFEKAITDRISSSLVHKFEEAKSSIHI